MNFRIHKWLQLLLIVPVLIMVPGNYGFGNGEPQITLNRTRLNYGYYVYSRHTDGSCEVFRTGTQTISIHNSGTGTLNWTASSDQDWLYFYPESGTNDGELSIFVYGGCPYQHDITYNGTITITDPNAANSPQTVSVVMNYGYYLFVQDPVPFGTLDTPVNNSTVYGSIPVTGWALDNVGINNVKIYREGDNDLEYIGDAVLVEGARPDIEQAYPEFPLNYKAGWGYMMLTNYLPDGIHRLHAIAEDVEGSHVTLGTRTIIIDNAHAVKPFGTIDRPGQGENVYGSTFMNFGWVLTPLPNTIPIDGSTIHVWVDGVPLGNPVYNQYRDDIAELFPHHNNSGGAQGSFILDTTQYENGVHTIQWTATDDAGNTDGIGSRYFMIYNYDYDTGENSTTERFKVQQAMFNVKYSQIPVDHPGPVSIRKGFNQNNTLQKIYPDEQGIITIEIKEMERLEIHLDEIGVEDEDPCAGYSVIDNELRRLPLGSTFDTEARTFYWQPGPGFVGEYQLAFIKKNQQGNMMLKNIVVNIISKFKEGLSKDRLPGKNANKGSRK
jgi:hypothetical protein